MLKNVAKVSNGQPTAQIVKECNEQEYDTSSVDLSREST